MPWETKDREEVLGYLARIHPFHFVFIFILFSSFIHNLLKNEQFV